MILLVSIWAAYMPGLAVAQHTVTIEVTGRPGEHLAEQFYITGSFQRWQPADEKWRMTPDADGKYRIKIPGIKDGFLLEYKFTRGSWKTLESTADGRLVSPRTARISADTTIRCVIAAWRDDFPASTASPQVLLMDSAFFMPQLGRDRRIWIYLPKDYATSTKRYPVLYMQDGQDLFDEATSEGRIGPLEWSVDEVLDQAANPCIVVAVEHHSDRIMRIKEYYARSNPEYPEVEGEYYLQFLTETLKPFVDKNYRTLPDKKHTVLAGSSMGGLITFYAGLRYPDVFGVLGVLSPSIWLDHRNIYKELDAIRNPGLVSRQRYYFYAGGNENRLKPDSSFVMMHDDVTEATEVLKTKAHPEIEVAINPTGRHGAVYWREAFPVFYEWISSDW